LVTSTLAQGSGVGSVQELRLGTGLAPAPGRGSAGLGLLGQALGFGALFLGLPPIVSVRFFDLAFPPALAPAQFLLSDGLRALAAPGASTAPHGLAPTPERTPMPAPDSGLRGIATSQAGFVATGLLAVLFFTFLTAPRLGRKLQAPTVSWRPRGFISPIELPG
jgi:hypothetical protein